MLILLMDAFWLLCFTAALGAWRAWVSQGNWSGAAGPVSSIDGGNQQRGTEPHWLILGLSAATATVGFGLIAWATPTLLSLWSGLTAAAVSVTWLAAGGTVALVWRRDLARGWVYAIDAAGQLVAWLKESNASQDSQRASAITDSPETTRPDGTSRYGRALALAWGAGTAVILALTFASAVLYPPTVWDSFSHHLPRIVQFIQNQTVAPFPTYYPSMNATYPLTAYINTQAALLWGSTAILNLTQWFAYACSAVLVYATTKLLGGSTAAARLATLVGLTAPSVALQASSTQYDLVTALWCLTAIVLLLVLRSRAHAQQSPLVLAVLLGAALGLGAVTKITFIVLLAPFCLWLAVSYLRTAGVRRTVTAGGLTLLVAVAIAVPWLGQNLALDSGALGTASPGNNFMLVQDRSPGALWTNAVRNLSMQLSTPVASVNNLVVRAAGVVAAPLGVPIDSPTNKEDYDRTYELPTWTFNPDTASSPVTALLITVAAATVAVGALRTGTRKQSGAGQLIYLSCAAIGTVTIAAFVTWNPFITRSLGTAVLVVAPIAGLGLATLADGGTGAGFTGWRAARRTVGAGLVASATAFCLLAVAFNASAPLVSRSTIFGGQWNGHWNLPYAERGWGVELPFLRPDINAVRQIAADAALQVDGASSPQGAAKLPPIALIGGAAGDHMPAYPLIVELQRAGFAVVYEGRFGPPNLPGVLGNNPTFTSVKPALVLSYDFEGDLGSTLVDGTPVARDPAYTSVHGQLTPELGTVLSVFRLSSSGEAVTQ